MKDLGRNIVRIELVELLPIIMEKKNDLWRLAQICCAFCEERYEVSYSFAKDYDLVNYRLIIGKDETVPSISRVYQAAIFYENEMRELFGLKVEHMKVDFRDKLYRISEETPFLEKEDK